MAAYPYLVAGIAFNPSSISHLFAWYDYDGIQSSDGVNIGDTTPHNWLDNTVNHYDLSWNGDGNPSVCRGGVNGLNGLKFCDNGSGDGGIWKTTITGGPVIDNQNISIFSVCYWTQKAASSILGITGNGGDAFLLDGTTGGVRFANSVTGGGSASSVPTLNTWHIVVISVTAGVVSLWLDNVLDSSIPNMAAGSSALTKIALGEAAGSAVVKIAQIACYSAGIGATNAAALYNYANAIYGVT